MLVLKSKDLNSTYGIDGKDGRWVKVKKYGDVIVVIGRFTLRNGIVNAVLAGLYYDGKLYFVGKVGNWPVDCGGLVDAHGHAAGDIESGLPFCEPASNMRGVFWCRPVLTARIKYTEWC